jgi:hypothetical protein
MNRNPGSEGVEGDLMWELVWFLCNTSVPGMKRETYRGYLGGGPSELNPMLNDYRIGWEIIPMFMIPYKGIGQFIIGKRYGNVIYRGILGTDKKVEYQFSGYSPAETSEGKCQSGSFTDGTGCM